MSRVHIHVDETISASPKAVLHINGLEMPMSIQELDNLMQDIAWAKLCLSRSQNTYFQSLAHKYLEAHHAVI